MRFPGFEVLDQSRRWDQVTAGVIAERMRSDRDFRFFTRAEQATATALCDRLLGMSADDRIPVAAMIDARLAAAQTDGWRYADMPEDGEAWRATLTRLQEDARLRYGGDFALCDGDQQDRLIQVVQDSAGGTWHELDATHVWSLWTRYACTAFYAHPTAWNEIGFSGPAYPRGYKNIGVDRLESYEVADAHPDIDPIRRGD
ncbi:MAG TPA: gluconate 2-dehydrogenase subunit 3 family protein [Micromonosporaceae bacterium]|jgi:hypothetical protein